MSRFSDPSQANAASPSRFYVWNQGVDDFDYVQLAQNWDRLDAIIGAPSSTQAWPATQGVGGGIWKEIQNVASSQKSLGEVFAWWWPFTGAETAAQIDTIVAAQNPGCVIADGRKVARGDHSFDTGTDIYVPDAVNSYLIGAAIANRTQSDTTVYAGTSAPAVPAGGGSSNVNNSNGAPGIVRTAAGSGTPSADGIVRGTMVGAITGANQGSMVLAVKDHYHTFTHTHGLSITGTGSGTAAVSSAITGANGWVTSPAYSNIWSLTGSGAKISVPNWSYGSGAVVASQGTVNVSVSGAGSTSTQSTTNTSQQILVADAHGSYAAGTAGGSQLVVQDSASTGTISVDRRPNSVPVLFLIKVLNIT